MPPKRSCEKQTQSKYINRPSPPFPANECCELIMVGNDGLLYISKKASSGDCRWVKVKSKSSPRARSPKSSPKSRKSSPKSRKLSPKSSPKSKAKSRVRSRSRSPSIEKSKKIKQIVIDLTGDDYE